MCLLLSYYLKTKQSLLPRVRPAILFSSGSQPGGFCPPSSHHLPSPQHLSVSEDIFSCHIWEWMCDIILWVEVRDAAKHPPKHTPLPNKELSGPKFQPWCKDIKCCSSSSSVPWGCACKWARVQSILYSANTIVLFTCRGVGGLVQITLAIFLNIESMREPCIVYLVNDLKSNNVFAFCLLFHLFGSLH